MSGHLSMAAVGFLQVGGGSSKSPSQNLFNQKNARFGKIEPAIGVGSHSAEYARQGKGVHMERRAATKQRVTNNIPSTKFVPIREDEAAKSFSAVVLRIDAGTLASAARRTKEAAKMWKAGRRCPNGSSLINLAADLPVVWAWLQGEVEKRRASSPDDVIAKLYAKAAMGGEEGAQARALLAQIQKSVST